MIKKILKTGPDRDQDQQSYKVSERTKTRTNNFFKSLAGPDRSVDPCLILLWGLILIHIKLHCVHWKLDTGIDDLSLQEGGGLINWTDVGPDFN